jgi:hypothetical protein
MSYDTNGYRQRWTVPCTDLLGHQKRVVVAVSPDHDSLLLITPIDTVRVSAEQAGELAQDIHDAAQQL